MAKYTPKTKAELKQLVQDESIALGDIDTSAITDMSHLFIDSTRRDFSGIESWDTSNVLDMRGMFAGAKYFNHNINSWDTSSVIDMWGMFMDAENFNQPLDKWDTSSVINMEAMFLKAKTFNQPLDSWDVSNVEFMFRTFAGAHKFKQKLNSWDISSVRDNQQMFWHSGVENLPKWWENKIWGKKLPSGEINDERDEINTFREERIKQAIQQARQNPRSKEERQKEREQKQAQRQARLQAQAQQKAQKKKRIWQVVLGFFAVVIVINVLASLADMLFKDEPNNAPKQSSTQKQQPQQSPRPQPQETQRVESQNSAQSAPEPSQNTPSNESVNSSENVAQSALNQNIQASFDCAKASTRVEKLICSDSELASLDIELANVYANTRNSLDAGGKKALLNEQRKWIDEYNQCVDKSCVQQQMQERIRALQNYSSKAQGLRLKTNDEYVNLRQSPSGEIITPIYKSDFDKISLKKLETNGKWIKVLYFAPNVSDEKDAITGYIHISQIDENSL